MEKGARFQPHMLFKKTDDSVFLQKDKLPEFVSARIVSISFFQ